ncbi:MAG: hypothetical protein M3069_27580 [Chloroflexota bacterium]|nr:hypothetical protein [Chloroflexota bacterium]
MGDWTRVLKPAEGGITAVSKAVQIWVERLSYRSIAIPNVRPRGRQVKSLTFAHGEFLLAVADHGRHNRLAWPSIPQIAKKLGISELRGSGLSSRG